MEFFYLDYLCRNCEQYIERKEVADARHKYLEDAVLHWHSQRPYIAHRCGEFEAGVADLTGGRLL